MREWMNDASKWQEDLLRETEIRQSEERWRKKKRRYANSEESHCTTSPF